MQAWPDSIHFWTTINLSDSISHWLNTFFFLGLSILVIHDSHYHRPRLHTLHAQVTFVQRHSSVRIAEFDQCQFGLESVQTKTPIKKRTKVMTNSDELMKALHGQFCPGTHTHQIISGSEGGLKRSTAAQVYPDRLCITICKALIAQEAKHPRWANPMACPQWSWDQEGPWRTKHGYGPGLGSGSCQKIKDLPAPWFRVRKSQI